MGDELFSGPSEVVLARHGERLRNHEEELKKHADALDELDSTYVTKAEFEPVRLVVFGLVGTILLSVLAAIVAIVVKSPP
ncbi:MAG: hypothetical protein E6R03_16985 [Hyphomicrobiaceae bacterium]|nr:MAG: hypothetical protein E6R03_16985 [Hyphomicrobiaceae bacterium]